MIDVVAHPMERDLRGHHRFCARCGARSAVACAMVAIGGIFSPSYSERLRSRYKYGNAGLAAVGSTVVP